MSTAIQELAIELSDLGDVARVQVQDPRVEETLLDALRRNARLTAWIQAADDDVEAHLRTSGTAVAVMVRLEDDTEAHAMSLRFPSAAEAKAFQRRLLAGGVLTAAIVVGAGAAQLAGQGSATNPAAPAAAPAPAVHAPAPAIHPGLRAEQAVEDREARDIVVPAPTVAPGLRGEQAGGDLPTGGQGDEGAKKAGGPFRGR